MVSRYSSVAETEQTVIFHAFVAQDLAHIIGCLSIGQCGSAKRGASVSARIDGNHAVVLQQARQQRFKVGNRAETAVKQDHDGGGFLTADLVVQACTLMVKKFGLHGLPFQSIRSICIGNIKKLLDSNTDIEHLQRVV